MIHTHRDLNADVEERCDVLIIGSGAGGGMLAEALTARGLDVVILEEGGHFTSKDFDGKEANAFPRLYQDRGLRASANGAITILQGRSVGGGTTINWTTCFRTPQRILDVWKDRFGLDLDLNAAFEAVEARLGIAEWPEEMANAQNRVLLDGGRKLGWEVKPLRRNVRGCANSGQCGTGCPFDAKQSQLITTIPAALERGARLYADTRAEKIEVEGGKVVAVHARVLPAGSYVGGPVRVTVRPRAVALCGGAINSPLLLLKSGINPNNLVGQHTFLHPVVAMPAFYPDRRVEGWAGAPQSIGSHQFIDRGDKVGFFLELPPLTPLLAGSGHPGLGSEQIAFMRRFPHIASPLAICLDGLHPGVEGGTVTLRADGRPKVDYPVTAPLVEAMAEAHRVLARLHLAAGAAEISTLHPHAPVIRSEADLSLLDGLRYGELEHSIFTAHQMGGCRMGADPAASVVDPEHRVRGVDNLFVVDGSVLPTALGVNPSQTIYGMAVRAAPFIG